MKKSLSTALLILCLGQSCSSDNGAVDLDVDFRKDGNALIVVNNNSFDYKEVDATVNESYHYKAPILKAKDSVRIPLSEFTTEEGTRYSAATSKLMSMSLYAETPDGKPGKVELNHK
ncbi:MAG: hypothetical protein JWP58_3258 [Hymenobacter sp.]|nr:hypothetical protein [Hymenobacter sp.]